MNQGGVKHAAAEPTRLENKRERRRGAAGRAAALRRAPSDSDCSGETASLSADSGDRVVRPAPPPTRSGKSRSRRRGSEWEVLEGLKDGQRFEKRPDVFNGYLHKKRKWPLKGWHKRFFVVDGGILVYARSPTDVARGRLHGSVDVGLSVISAKARRRRIDIDADEFIYHLRAKTPEVFRTWLNVLKAHRLYRQHLLTFGARESVPKIHAPLDDLPPTDNSSRTSSSFESSSLSSTEDFPSNPKLPRVSQLYVETKMPSHIDSSSNMNMDQNATNDWHSTNVDNSELTPLNNANKCNDALLNNNKSLCSMNCVARRLMDKLKRKKSPEISIGSTDGEKQMVTTDLDLTSLQSSDLKSSLMKSININSNTKNIFPTNDFNVKTSLKKVKENRSMFHENKVEPTTTFFFFTRKKHDVSDCKMSRSNKSTNLVKYRNVMDEPKLKKPMSKCLLIDKNIKGFSENIKHQTTACDIVSKHNISVQVEKENILLQNVLTNTTYDEMTERLIVSLFENCCINDEVDIKCYINQVIEELHGFKSRDNAQPVKTLFRCLLGYWLRNTSVSFLKSATTRAQSINRQSNGYFTKDEILSSAHLNRINKFTQCSGRKRDTVSVEKERQIQEIEMLLKNTVYICDTTRSIENKAKDIKITQTLIDNIGIALRSSVMNKSSDNCKDENTNSSAEIPKIQETINHLISDTSIPPDMAKEILGVYLDVLRDDGKSLSNSSSESGDNSVENKYSDDEPICDVNTEAVVTRVSKSVATLENTDSKKIYDKSAKNYKTQPLDPGQLYLMEILDKITSIFSKARTSNRKNVHNVRKDETIQSKVDNVIKDELGRSVKEFPEKKLICENCKENSVLIDLSKYDVEQISMFSDPAIKGIMSITIKLKEKPPNFGEPEKTLVSGIESNHWMSYVNPSVTTTNNALNKDLYAALSPLTKKMFSGSDATSKAYRVIHESEHSFELSFKSSHSLQADLNLKKSFETNEETQSCYVMSLKNGNLPSTLQSKKKLKLKECKGVVINTNTPEVPAPEEPNVCDRPVLKIIDEKFILLLLENLTLLSKNVPSLYKDLNNLYIKLKKKHDKVIKNISNAQGLSLLGKIYNEETPKATEANDTQISTTIDPKNNKSIQTFKEINDISTIISNANFAIEKYLVDQAISAYILTDTKNRCTKPYRNKGVLSKKRNLCNLTQTPSFTSMSSMTNAIKLREKMTSNSNWFKKINSKDCACNTLSKSIMQNKSARYIKLQQPAHSRNIVTENASKNTSHKHRQKFSNKISLLSEVSAQSQTERNMIKFNKKSSNKIRDYNVYELFLSQTYGPTRSSSISVFSEERKESDDLKTLYRCNSDPYFGSGLISPTLPLRGPQAGFVSGTPGGRLAGWIIESGGPLENASRELGQAQLSVQQLQRLLDALDMQQQVHHDTDVSLEGASPSVKKDRRKFGLRKKKSNSKCASVELQQQLPHLDPSNSHMALSALTAPPSPGGGASSVPNSAASLPIACAAARPQSLPGAESLGATGPASLTSLTPDHQLREDFTVLAKDLVANLKTVVSTLVCERGRLRAAMEAAEGASTPGGPMMAALRTNLNSALQQNSELRSRLSRIHDTSDIADISSVGPNSDQQVNRQFQQSLSYSSSCVSASEFFDAEEHEDDDDLKDAEIAADDTGVIELDGDSSSEAGSLSSEEGSASSDNSDGAILSAEQVTLRLNNGSESRPTSCWQRRTCLPSPRPNPGGPSLWNLLYKNIGKDLSQISMPVTINEPLNMLQRLCEELEYSELLEAAASSKSPVERMSLIAAFAVSAYAATAHRAASKPFNPLLHETYECVRDDRAFRFIAEQVSHHPPISACQAESARWCFWQEARIKTKFWGKSMEFQPTGRVHVKLFTTGDHYSWNKVTTCVHNLFGGQRWVDQYGEMQIICHGTNITAKLNFVKASSWSGSRHEVRGAVSAGSGGGSGGQVRLAGRWSEALYAGDPPAAKLLWRTGAMPPNSEMYYGFTRFAMELNEIEPGTRYLLPHTDTRLRPDQRALEEGDVEAAEQYKLQLEQSQRDRRRDEHQHPAWFRKVLEDGDEMWVHGGDYWKAREAGFADLALAPRLW